jgi:hypothetical protein
MSLRLYDLSLEVEQLHTMLVEADPEVEQAIKDTLAGAADALAGKLEACAAVVRALELEAAAVEDEAKRLKSRAEARSNAAAKLKAAMLEAMQRCALDKVKGQRFTVSQARNPGALVVDDGVTIDASFYIPQPPKLDKAALKAAIAAGQTIPGARIEHGVSLRIR